MLIATQLLAGSGGSSFICIHDDGSFCCIDAGSESCKCCDDKDSHLRNYCDDEDQAHHGTWAVSVDKHFVDACNVDHHCGAAEKSVSCRLDHCDPSGCNHIPLMVCSDQASVVARTFLMTRGVQLGRYMACLPQRNWVGDTTFNPSLLTQSNRDANVPDSALALMATVIIRC